MRTVTNYYLLNLSVADLLMSSMNCVFNFIFLLNNDWPFGALYCTVNNFIANLSVASSVFTLVAISLDRYIAIVKPLRHRSRNKGKLVMVCIWLLGALLAFPCLLYSKTRVNRWVHHPVQSRLTLIDSFISSNQLLERAHQNPLLHVVAGWKTPDLQV